jgi:outer membrane lipoprotein SlyB
VIFHLNISIKYLLAVTVLILLTGCASTYRGYGYSGVIIDEKGVDMRQFHNDLSECEQYASAVPKGERTATSAVQAAVIGGAVGAIFNGSKGAGQGAATGAIAGGVKGATSAETEKKRIVKSCLRYRAYRVLN